MAGWRRMSPVLRFSAVSGTGAPCCEGAPHTQECRCYKRSSTTPALWATPPYLRGGSFTPFVPAFRRHYIIIGAERDRTHSMVVVRFGVDEVLPSHLGALNHRFWFKFNGKLKMYDSRP